MSGEYTIELAIDTWTDTIAHGEATDPAATAITMDPLNAAWSMAAGYPSQPTPTTASFGLYVPDIATGPRPVQGSRVEITITTPDHDPLLTEIRPVFEFVGLISDVDATPYGDGLAYSIVATEYTSTLGEERIGDEPWPAEPRYERLTRIIAASSLPIEIQPVEQLWLENGETFGLDVAARDVDAQPTRDLLDGLLQAAMSWLGFGPSWWITGFWSNSFNSPYLNTWLKPIFTQSVDPATGAVTFPIVFLPGGGPDNTASLPYTVQLAGGVLNLVRKPITPTTSLVAWIPAAAIEADSIVWRQNKAANINRVRVTAPNFLFGPSGAYNIGSTVGEYPDLIEQNGPNERVISLDAEQFNTAYADTLLYGTLGRYYDAQPRWTFESFTVRAEEIAAGDQWPRLFNPRTHAQTYGNMWDQAAGRFIFITDIADAWNLHDRPDYFGRLAGATLNLAGGKIRFTATLAHRLPWGMGRELPEDSADLNDGTYWPTRPNHRPISYADLAAGANPNVNQCGDLTPADLQLVEG